jgi:hypothetical protein
MEFNFRPISFFLGMITLALIIMSVYYHSYIICACAWLVSQIHIDL